MWKTLLNKLYFKLNYCACSICWTSCLICHSLSYCLFLNQNRFHLKYPFEFFLVTGTKLSVNLQRKFMLNLKIQRFIVQQKWRKMSRKWIEVENKFDQLNFIAVFQMEFNANYSERLYFSVMRNHLVTWDKYDIILFLENQSIVLSWIIFFNINILHQSRKSILFVSRAIDRFINFH